MTTEVVSCGIRHPDCMPRYNSRFACCRPEIKRLCDFAGTREEALHHGAQCPVFQRDKRHRPWARIVELGGLPLPMTPAKFGKHIADETEKWCKVIRAANIKAG